MTPTADKSELLWQAFQYVSGELAVAESQAFEARLERDPEACDALAEAVLLCESVVVAEWESRRGTVTHQSPAANRPARRLVAAALATAAALLVMVWISGGFDGGLQVVDQGATGGPARSTDVAPSRSMLSVWVSLKEDETPASEFLPGDATREEGLGDATADVPDWMFAALVSSATIPEMNELLPGVPLLPEEPL